MVIKNNLPTNLDLSGRPSEGNYVSLILNPNETKTVSDNYYTLNPVQRSIGFGWLTVIQLPADLIVEEEEVQTTVTILPTDPALNTTYNLIQIDTYNKAPVGQYIHNGTEWYCIVAHGVYDLGNLSGTVTLGNVFNVTYKGTTIGETTWIFPALFGAGDISLRLTNGGSQTQNWDGDIIWRAGEEPTLVESGTDWLVFVTDDGTNWEGTVAMNEMS
ncbi:MAG: hypothetical protein ACOCWG_04000 [bacterium]